MTKATAAARNGFRWNHRTMAQVILTERLRERWEKHLRPPLTDHQRTLLRMLSGLERDNNPPVCKPRESA